LPGTHEERQPFSLCRASKEGPIACFVLFAKSLTLRLRIRCLGDFVIRVVASVLSDLLIV